MEMISFDVAVAVRAAHLLQKGLVHNDSHRNCLTRLSEGTDTTIRAIVSLPALECTL